MTKNELLTILHALEHSIPSKLHGDDDYNENGWNLRAQALTILLKEGAKPSPVPVAWMSESGSCKGEQDMLDAVDRGYYRIPLYREQP